MLLNFFSLNSKWLKKNKNNKMFDNLLFQEQFKYLKTSHSYYLVDPSPWPIVAAFGAFMLTIGGWSLFSTGFCVILYGNVYLWWRDVIREATFEDNNCHIMDYWSKTEENNMLKLKRVEIKKPIWKF